MKKILIGGVLVVALGAYAWWASTQKTDTAVPTNSIPSETTNPAATSTNNTPAATGTYKNGTYTSAVANAFYGPMQIKVTIAAGKISDITFLQFPNDRKETIEISNNAMPILKQEAIAVQSAKVNNISGATQTVDGFKEALNNALTQAKA